ncbi:hypothetical protein [Geodermatophilus obscurus]|uniref:hypothetical protein n=1 Tax=Geodermatophilus obscurus TaxID=1861 RepID=UPI001140E3C8|nr:hypothetical protein [Geodermatophilus obscurus]
MSRVPRRRPWSAVPVAVTLLLVGASALLAREGSPLTTERGQLRTYLDVFDETNLPTWWAASVLVAAALACGVVAALSGPGVARRRWSLLAGLTAALSVDEATVLHERLDRAVLPWLSPEDFPYLWVVPGAVLGLAVVVSVVGLTRAAPAPARRRLLLGFGLLLGSALGGEVVQGLLVAEGLLGRPFVVAYHLEELGETLGAVALLAGAVRMIDVVREPAGVRLRLRTAVPPSSVGVGRQADDHLPDVAPA